LAFHLLLKKILIVIFTRKIFFPKKYFFSLSCSQGEKKFKKKFSLQFYKENNFLKLSNKKYFSGTKNQRIQPHSRR